MSLSALCSIHTVVRQSQVVSNDDDMGAVESWVDEESLACRITTASPSDVTEYAKRGYAVTHNVYFAADPRMNETKRLRFGARVFAFRGVRNPDELAQSNAGPASLVYWVVACEERTTHPENAAL